VRTEDILRLIQQACEYSVISKNTMDPTLSLVAIVKACATLDTLRDLYSHQGIGYLRHDFQSIYDVIYKQKENTLSEVLAKHSPTLQQEISHTE
jgi:hypothetical protein